MTVLIIGAGPAGLIAALTLLQNGVPVRVIDKESTYHVGQRGAGLHPRAQEIYHFLGLLLDVKKVATNVLPLSVYALPGGREIVKTFRFWDPRDPTPDVPFANAIMIGQNVNEGFIRAHLAKYGCSVELNAQAVGLEDMPDGVQATIIKKRDGEQLTETTRFDYIIGADGAKGATRKFCRLQFLGETDNSVHLIIADVKLKGLNRDVWHHWGDWNTKLVAIRPTETEGRFWALIGGRAVDYENLSTKPDEFRKFVCEHTCREDIVIEEFITLSDWKSNIRMVDTFQKGRVFLAGDAAHVHSPTGGQGMNSGIMDSFNLGWKLASVVKKRSPPSLLSSYTEERLPVIAQMLNNTTALLKNSVQQGFSNLPPRPPNLNQLGINYRWSSIVVDERPCAVEETIDRRVNTYDPGPDGLPHAGDRAPEAPGLLEVSPDNGTVTSFFQIFKPTYHSVLVFSTDVTVADSILHTLRRYPLDAMRLVFIFPSTTQGMSVVSSFLTIRDNDGHAYRAYNVDVGETTIVIVRPDGVVGAIVQGHEGVWRYFDGVFIH